MLREKLRVSMLTGKENNALVSNRPLKAQDYHHQLKKLPFPVEEFEASDLSSIVSESELKSKETFDAMLSKKSSARNFAEEPPKINGSHPQPQDRKRASMEPRKGTNAALKSMLTDKNSQGSFYSEIDNLRETNYRLQQQNKSLKLQLDRLIQQSHVVSRFESKQSLVHDPTFESRTPTIHGTSFDSFDKLDDSNRMLRNKLNICKRNEQLERQPDRPPTNHSTECCRQNNNVFTVSSIYSKAFQKNRMPELDNFAVALKNYFQQFEDTFLKINFMFDNLEGAQQSSEKYLQTRQLVSLLKIPVMYKNKPKMVDSLLNVTKSSNRSQSKEKSLVETFSPELLSAEDTLALMEQILSKVVRSNNMMRLCRENKQLLGFTSKLLRG